MPVSPQVPENPKHLFVGCSWINVDRTWIEQWTGGTLYDRELRRGLINLKNKQWKQFKTEILVAAWGAVIYISDMES